MNLGFPSSHSSSDGRTPPAVNEAMFPQSESHTGRKAGMLGVQCCLADVTVQVAHLRTLENVTVHVDPFPSDVAHIKYESWKCTCVEDCEPGCPARRKISWGFSVHVVGLYEFERDKRRQGMSYYRWKVLLEPPPHTSRAEDPIRLSGDGDSVTDLLRHWKGSRFLVICARPCGTDESFPQRFFLLIRENYVEEGMFQCSPLGVLDLFCVGWHKDYCVKFLHCSL